MSAAKEIWCIPVKAEDLLAAESAFWCVLAVKIFYNRNDNRYHFSQQEESQIW